MRRVVTLALVRFELQVPGCLPAWKENGGSSPPPLPTDLLDRFVSSTEELTIAGAMRRVERIWCAQKEEHVMSKYTEIVEVFEKNVRQMKGQKGDSVAFIRDFVAGLTTRLGWPEKDLKAEFGFNTGSENGMACTIHLALPRVEDFGQMTLSIGVVVEPQKNRDDVFDITVGNMSYRVQGLSGRRPKDAMDPIYAETISHIDRESRSLFGAIGSPPS